MKKYLKIVILNLPVYKILPLIIFANRNQKNHSFILCVIPSRSSITMVLPHVRKKQRGPGVAHFMIGILVGFLLTMGTVIKVRNDTLQESRTPLVGDQLDVVPEVRQGENESDQPVGEEHQPEEEKLPEDDNPADTDESKSTEGDEKPEKENKPEAEEERPETDEEKSEEEEKPEAEEEKAEEEEEKAEEEEKPAKKNEEEKAEEVKPVEEDEEKKTDKKETVEDDQKKGEEPAEGNEGDRPLEQREGKPTEEEKAKISEDDNNDENYEKEFSPLGSVADPNKSGILVVYSGPLYFEDESDSEMTQLYRANLEYFLNHGVDCEVQDTVIVVGLPVYHKYKNQIQEMDSKCQETNHRVKMVYRPPECADMGSWSTVLHGNFVDFDQFDFFIFLTASMSGPFEKRPDDKPWTEMFTSRVTETTKLVGLSHVCDKDSTHVQEQALCLDKAAFNLFRESNIVMDCAQSRRQHIHNEANIQQWRQSIDEKGREYNGALNQLVLNHGYALTSILREPVEPITKENRDNCVAEDMWTVSNLKEAFGGEVPTWRETILWRSSRYLPKDIAQTIGYKGKINWTWE